MNRSVTFSGLLNALDGVRSQEGRILMMTTNHKEKLDPALLRPGRADVHVQLNYASENQMKGLFRKFFPDSTPDEQARFANELPEFKINMAKLQGHFLKYRDNVQGAIENAKFLLDMEYQIKDMSVNEWLRRLNMHKYTSKFRKDGIKRVSDLRYVNDGELMNWGMTAITDRRRVMKMIEGDETAKQLFALQSVSQARTLISQFLPVNDPQHHLPFDPAKEMEEILQIVGDEEITGYQLLDIFDENKDLAFVKRKLQHKVNQNQLIAQGLVKEKEDDGKEEEEDKKDDHPTVNIEAMLKSLGFSESIPKLKENEIHEPEIFFGLDDDKIIELLEIKTEGKKFRFKEKMKEIKDKHEKAKAKKQLAEEMSEIVSETFEKL
jgi:SpoVK/Ycf46/Vps4 family AAA+-type ATPase